MIQPRTSPPKICKIFANLWRTLENRRPAEITAAVRRRREADLEARSPGVRRPALVAVGVRGRVPVEAQAYVFSNSEFERILFRL